MIVWKEPFLPEYPHVQVSCSIETEEAIEVQRFMGEMEGYPYESDKEALIDFMVVRNAIDTDNNFTIGHVNETALIGH